VLARALVGSIAAPLRRTAGIVHYRGADLLEMTPPEIRSFAAARLDISRRSGNSFDPTLPVGEQLVEKLRAVRPGCGRKEPSAGSWSCSMR